MTLIIIAAAFYLAGIAYFAKALVSIRNTRKEYHAAIAEMDVAMESALADLDAQLAEINNSVATYMEGIRAATQTQSSK